MKLLSGFVLFVSALCVVTSLSQRDTETLARLTKEIDEILADISIDITFALGGEVNDLVTGKSPLLKELKDVITQLRAIKL